ncbi:UDP-glucuronate 4-epimerase [Desulfosarcina sp. BuS5]|uniref:NAD-dependent epimerase n=1 Tax=Desulfosarcina sp. BuS5 TaxID=933262 RepID=UPI0004885459|nr:NAD-dependent epimerase [Desulfosarcina sp. BuS5]WDN87044.1 UDP-glucuronate 4-epimerase [Desulfosarcina sp. BuS5]
MNPDIPILVTGAAGFIGFHLAMRLLNDGFKVVGLDNLNSYYDVKLKKARLEELKPFDNFSFFKADLADAAGLENIFKNNHFDIVVNLAAQAGVRYSLENPASYVNSNLAGFVNLLECCRHYKVNHMVFASSSSVYGANTKMPFSVHHNVDHPVSLYAATKKANELMAHTYSHLFDLPCTGLRFFTVYGPWGRPDMALFLFTDAILKNKPIKIFNNGNMQRDFTYIDDIVEGVVRVMDKIPEPNPKWSGDSPDPGTSYVKYKIYNIGNNQPVKLMDFIETIEKVIGKKAQKNFMEMQAGDVKATYANIDDLTRDVGFTPSTPLETGIKNFVQWFKSRQALQSTTHNK